MGSIDGIDIGVNDGNVGAGAAFRLSAPAPIDFSYSVPSGATVLMDSGKTFLVVHAPASLGYDDLLLASHEDAQMALDILGGMHRHFLSLPMAHGEHLMWTRTPQGVAARFTDVAHPSIRTEVSWVVTRAVDGSVERFSDRPPPAWHPALRYLRYSQLRDDLYAAYREAFLAVESFLSTVEPKQPNESERAWHIRANQQLAAAGVDFGLLVHGHGVPDPVTAFVDDQFKALRCALFHAKAGQPHFLPGALGDRRLVADALERLGRYLTETGRLAFNIECSVGAMTFAGMAMYVDTFSGELVLACSSDPTPASCEDVEISPLGHPVTLFPTAFEGVVDELGYEFGFLGSIAVSAMEATTINTFASRVPDALMTRSSMRDLELAGVDLFEYCLNWSFSNRIGLKGAFSL